MDYILQDLPQFDHSPRCDTLSFDEELHAMIAYMHFRITVLESAGGSQEELDDMIAILKCLEASLDAVSELVNESPVSIARQLLDHEWARDLRAAEIPDVIDDDMPVRQDVVLHGFITRLSIFTASAWLHEHAYQIGARRRRVYKDVSSLFLPPIEALDSAGNQDDK